MESTPKKSTKAHKAISSILLTYSICSSFQLTYDLHFFSIFLAPKGGKPLSKKAKTLASRDKTATRKSNRMVVNSQVTTQLNRSSLPIDNDEYACEETI